MDIASIGVKIFNLVQFMIMTITNLVKKARGQDPVYSDEDFSKIGY